MVILIVGACSRSAANSVVAGIVGAAESGCRVPRAGTAIGAISNVVGEAGAADSISVGAAALGCGVPPADVTTGVIGGMIGAARAVGSICRPTPCCSARRAGVGGGDSLPGVDLRPARSFATGRSPAARGCAGPLASPATIGAAGRGGMSIGGRDTSLVRAVTRSGGCNRESPDASRRLTDKDGSAGASPRGGSVGESRVSSMPRRGSAGAASWSRDHGAALNWPDGCGGSKRDVRRGSTAFASPRLLATRLSR